MSEAAWTLLFVGLALGVTVGGAGHDLGGGLIGAAPFVGLIVTFAAGTGEIRMPDQEEALAIFRAEQLTGVKLPFGVRMPRTRRMWIDKIITGSGIAIGLTVIGLASL